MSNKGTQFRVCGKKERQSNLELLRILAALFVIVLHYNNKNMGKAFLYTEAMPQHYQFLLLFEMLAICAVNIFVMISGYFLCTSTRVQVWKVLRLYIDVIAISVLRYVLLCVAATEQFSVLALIQRFIPLSWYTAVYCGLYLISPYLNRMFTSMTRSQFRVMILVFFFVLSVWPSGVEFLSKVLDFSPDSLSPISAGGSGEGYTLVNFILMYLLGAYCRLHTSEESSGKKCIYGLLVYCGCVLVNTVYANLFFGRAASYCNPLVVIQTVAIFIVFQNIKVQSKLINEFASCAFGVYLMHSAFMPYVQIERHVTGKLWVIPIHIIASAILIFIASAAVYWIYQKMLNPVFRWCQKKLEFLSYGTDCC